MNKLKILFLTHYFPPEVNAPANRTFEHTRIWAKNDEVLPIVITNFPNHPKGKVFEGYKNKLHQMEIIEGIEVHRVWTFVTANEGFLLRTINYIIYMLAAFIFVLISGVKFDIVIATSPQFFAALCGKYVSKIKKKPFILEIRDLWPESIITVGAIKNKFLIKYLEKVELDLYRKANHIITVTKSFKDYMIEKGIPAEKISIIYNGISPELFVKNGNKIPEEIKSFLGDSFSVGYIGTIGLAHSLETLVNAAEKLSEHSIKFILVGSGANDKIIEKMILEKKLKNIKIFPLQKKEFIPSIISHLNLFCVHLKKSPLFRTVIPSKIFEGMVLKKPILMGVEGEASEIVKMAKCAITFEPENSEDLSNKILEAMKKPELLEELGNNGYNFVLKNFNRNILAVNYLELLKKIVNGN